MSLYAAHCVVAGGMEIGSIESVGGKTLEKGYYQELATVYAGYAAMIRATGIFFSSILAYIGLKIEARHERMQKMLQAIR